MQLDTHRSRRVAGGGAWPWQGSQVPAVGGWQAKMQLGGAEGPKPPVAERSRHRSRSRQMRPRGRAWGAGGQAARRCRQVGSAIVNVRQWHAHKCIEACACGARAWCACYAWSANTGEHSFARGGEGSAAPTAAGGGTARGRASGGWIARSSESRRETAEPEGADSTVAVPGSPAVGCGSVVCRHKLAQCITSRREV